MVSWQQYTANNFLLEIHFGPTGQLAELTRCKQLKMQQMRWWLARRRRRASSPSPPSTPTPSPPGALLVHSLHIVPFCFFCSMWGDNSTYHSTRPPSAATPALPLSRPDSASLQVIIMRRSRHMHTGICAFEPKFAHMLCAHKHFHLFLQVVKNKVE